LDDTDDTSHMTGKGDRKRRRALDAYIKLQRAAALTAIQVDDAVQPFGLSTSQFGVLDTIATRGAVHQQELAEALGRSKAQMTAIIDALEARGLVRRERHAIDRRFIAVHLTPEGRAVLDAATPARTDAILQVMGVLTGEQRTRLARLCRRMLRALDPLEEDPHDPDPHADDDGDEHGEDETDAHREPATAAAHTTSPILSDGRTALPPDSRSDTGS
jgi:MarR family 2-MHQ and catechol resistance regulon transcriptional repressor